MTPLCRTGDVLVQAGQPGAVVLVTTNACLNAAGELVLGRGAARAARDRYPGLARHLGAWLAAAHPPGGCYGILWPQAPYPVGAFQVKYDWRAPADPALIAYSAGLLAARALAAPELIFHVNYPGIGNGRLTLPDVAPLLAGLPANVQVWMLPA